MMASFNILLNRTANFHKSETLNCSREKQSIANVDRVEDEVKALSGHLRVILNMERITLRYSLCI